MKASQASIRASLIPGRAGLSGAAKLVVAIGFVLAAVSSAFYATSAALKSHEVVQQALRRASSNATVVEMLGTPLEPGWFVSGSITTQALFGDADVVVPISGPKRGGTLYATARRTNGRWEYLLLNVAVDGRSSVIDLR